MKKNEKVHDDVAEYIRTHPDDTFQTISSDLAVAYSTVSRIAKAYGLSRRQRLEHINLPEVSKENTHE